MIVSKKVSGSLMVANCISMILIIAIHYNSRLAINTSLGYDLNYMIQEIVTNGIARSAVPIFAIISGYFLVKKVATFDQYCQTLRSRFYTLLIPYLIASIIIFVSSFLFKTILKPGTAPALDLFSLFHNIIIRPASIQFWFLRDLIILTILSPLLLHAKKLIFYGIGILFACLWFANIQPFPLVGEWYLLNIETLFFFWFGGMLFRTAIDLEPFLFCQNWIKVIVGISWVVLIVWRVSIDPDLDVWYVNRYTVASILLYKMAIIVGIASILQLSAVMRNSRFLVYASGLTFFVFLFHLVPLIYLTYFTTKIIGDAYSFYPNFLLAIVLSFSLAHFTSKKLGWFYVLVSGGRHPEKAVQRIT